MFFPVSTDAQVIHWPVATVSMIVAHTLIFIVTESLPPLSPAAVSRLIGSDGQEIDLSDIPELGDLLGRVPGWVPYALSHGDGLHPLQWVTSMLIHANFAHLLGNMMFLWVFGLYVEGMAGWQKFLALYFGIGIAQNILEQLIFLPFPDMPSLGASSAICGLMMIAVLWCPQDNVQCIVFLIFRPFLVNVPTLLMGAFYFLSDFTITLFSGFQLGTGLLHVMGGALGLVAGYAMLRWDAVETDDRDIFSMIRGDRPKKKSAQRLKQEADQKTEQRQQHAQQIELAWKSFDMHVAAGQFDTAHKQLSRIQSLQRRPVWTEPRLWNWINQLLKQREFDRALCHADEYLSSFPDRAEQIQLAKAQIVGRRKGLPMSALRILKQIDLGRLGARQKTLYDQLFTEFTRQVEAGALEPESD